MNPHYLQTHNDTLVPTDLESGPYFHTWDSSKNVYTKLKYVPEVNNEKSAAGLKIAEMLIKAISGPTMDHEAIRNAKQEYVALTSQ